MSQICPVLMKIYNFPQFQSKSKHSDTVH